MFLQESFEDLIAASEETMSCYFVKRSRQNVISHLRQLCLFCVFFKKRILPVEHDTLLAFVEIMSRKSGFDHIQHVLSSIKFLHDYTENEYVGNSFQFKVLLRGLRRKLAKPARQVLPITPEMLILMYQYIDINNPSDLAHWCAFLLALRLLYRKSSIAPETMASFNPHTGLSRQKAVLSNGVILVFQNHSKTNQFMASTRTIPVVPGSITELDPVYHYGKLVAENPCPDHYPAFSYYHGGSVKCVTHKSFTTYLKSLLVKIGLDPNQWSGHSFRRGGASLLYRLGIDPLTIQAVGDWTSDTFLRYLEVNIDRLYASQVAMGAFTCS